MKLVHGSSTVHLLEVSVLTVIALVAVVLIGVIVAVLMAAHSNNAGAGRYSAATSPARAAAVTR